MKARLILLCGLPGAGKTTLAREFAKEMPAMSLCLDEWKADLGIDYYDEVMGVRLERQLFKLAWELLGLGQDVILEFGVWAESERTELRNTARGHGHSVELYFLDIPFKELARRLEIRNAKAEHGAAPIDLKRLEEYANVFQPPSDKELALFDKPTLRQSRRIKP
jgi:predicted kinase